MKKLSLFAFALMFVWAASSCSKDDPTLENNQEEVGKAWLIFTEVKRELHGDHYHYHAVENPTSDTIRFDDKGLPPVGAHLHLTEGKTYRLDLKAFDFANRETQHTFVEKDDIHQAFITGAPAEVLEYAYADKKGDKSVNVGVTGYLTILKETEKGFDFRYTMRHLNAGVKAAIKASDWNKDPAGFAGANDLDLTFDLHPVEGEHHDHDGGEGGDHDHDGGEGGGHDGHGH